jgi:UDP-glucose 4-epimerase
VHVSDVADAHILADEYLQSPYNNQPRTFNLGTGKGHSVLEVIQTAVTELDIPILYLFRERLDGDPSRLVANCDLAKRYLNFKPKHNLKSILRTAYTWYGKQRDRTTV